MASILNGKLYDEIDDTRKIILQDSYLPQIACSCPCSRTIRYPHSNSSKKDERARDAQLSMRNPSASRRLSPVRATCAPRLPKLGRSSRDCWCSKALCNIEVVLASLSVYCLLGRLRRHHNCSCSPLTQHWGRRQLLPLDVTVSSALAFLSSL